MGNTSCILCTNKREHLDEKLKENAVHFMLNSGDINTRWNRTLSFGAPPKNIFSQESAFPSRQNVGFLPVCHSESEKDTERDSPALVEKNIFSLASCHIPECTSYRNGESGAKYVDSSISDGKVFEKGGFIDHTERRFSGTIRSDCHGESSHEKGAAVRMRRDAIQVTPIEPPDPKFMSGKQFFIQNSGYEWEMVILEHWNHWNGTWQVRGEDGISFPAPPIALKNDEEYEFLSRKRSFRLRSFNSMEI